MLDPRLKEFGFDTEVDQARAQLNFWDKKSLSKLYGRSQKSRFERPLTPNEVGIIHLIVQQQVMQESVIRETRALLGLNPALFYNSSVIGDRVAIDPRFVACLDYLDDRERLEQVLPEVFGEKNNEHHVIPRSLKSDFRTGRKDGNTINLNSKFHTRHWHDLYLNRDPQRIDRMLYFDLGYIQVLAPEVQEKVSRLLSLDRKDYYRPELIRERSDD